MHQIFSVAWFTFFQAALSTIMALLIGLPAAFFCGRRSFFGRKFLLSLSVVPFCIPSLIIALGYVTFLGLNGGLNQFLMFVFGLSEPPVKILYSFVGLIIAHGFYNFPLIMKNVSDSWGKLPMQQAESARLLGAGEGRIFRTVTIFQLIPSIISSSLLVFIYCFLSFIMVLLFGRIGNSTLEVEIYKAARATLNFSRAGSLAGIETFILCVITVVYCFLEQKTASKVKGFSSMENPRKKIKGITESILFAITIVLILIFFIAPLMGIIFNAFTSSKKGTGFTFQTFVRIFKMRSFFPSLKSTFLVGIATSLFCTLIAFVYSVFLRFIEKKAGRKMNVFLKVIPMLPMSVSSVVVGVIITAIVKRGNAACLVLAQTALTWPLAFKVIYPQLSKTPDETMDSALMLSKNKLDMVKRVIFPQSLPSLLSAICFCFAVSAGDTTLPLVLAIPHFDTLSLFTYRLAGAYRFNEACASGVILGIICAGIFKLSMKKK